MRFSIPQTTLRPTAHKVQVSDRNQDNSDADDVFHSDPVKNARSSLEGPYYDNLFYIQRSKMTFNEASESCQKYSDKDLFGEIDSEARALEVAEALEEFSIKSAWIGLKLENGLWVPLNSYENPIFPNWESKLKTQT